jgi:hypothetical protein
VTRVSSLALSRVFLARLSVAAPSHAPTSDLKDGLFLDRLLSLSPCKWVVSLSAFSLALPLLRIGRDLRMREECVGGLANKSTARYVHVRGAHTIISHEP